MRRIGSLLLAAAAWLPAGCSGPDKPAAPAVKRTVEQPRITQFYATPAALARGEKALLCYGVENARTVWLSPPRQELSAALARCVEAAPSATTTYTLTAEGAGGQSATQQLTVAVGPPPQPRVHIVEVTVSALTLRRGDPVSICYHVENAVQVRIDPIRFRAGSERQGCAMDQPQQTTTYTLTAKGGGGAEDTERVTVTVK